MLQAAKIQVKTGDWRGAADSATKALAAGMDNPVSALILQGTALAELDEYEEALVIFRKVTVSGNEGEQQTAAAWIRYIEERLSFQSQVAATSRK